MVSKAVHFLGSIKLAVPLLGAIATVLIWATFYETQVGSATVQREVYKSVWFGGLMLLLAINLGISVLSRYPWRGARKVGFALTHLGLIVLIAGSAAVIHSGVEGMLLVRIDSGPASLMRLEGELLDITGPGHLPQRVEVVVRPDGTVAPATAAGLTLLGYSDNAIKTVDFQPGGAVSNPAVRLSLTSPRMGQTLERSLAIAPAAYSKLDIGPAQLQIMQVATAAERAAALAPPQPQQHPLGLLQLSLGNLTRELDVATDLQQSVSLNNGLQVSISNVWPDFRLDSQNQPTTASSDLNNPAVQLDVSMGSTQEKWFVFARNNLPPVRTVLAGEPSDLQVIYEAPPSRPEAFFRVVVDPDLQLHYGANSSKGFVSGPLQVGDTVIPGWADFQITLTELIPNAQIERQVVPVPADTAAGTPALQVATPDGKTYWLPWGEPTSLADASGEFLAAFSPKMMQLPFAVALEDFIVERNEGSESVAMWTSQIRIADPHRSQSLQRNVWMNHPTWYRGWKLAQASWNPGDLQQSTLQVKREPAWVTALTWLGSLLVVTGVGVMFYGPAVSQAIRRWRRRQEASAAAASYYPPHAPSLDG